MKFITKISLCAALLVMGNLAAVAQTTAFTYQGRLDNAGSPANGTYDLQFTLYDAAELGTAQGPTLATSGTVVTDGLFTMTLDFGDQFAGADRWLELGVRTHGGGDFTLLSPRQPLTPTPYAHYAPNAGTAASASSVNAANISGTIPLAQLPPDVVTNGASGVSISGTFSGDGIGLSNLNVSSLQQIRPTVAAFGSNFYGVTTVPADLGNVVAIAGGFAHSLALRSDGTVAAWGAEGYNGGQTTVPVGLSNVVAIAAGNLHSLALRSDGTVVGWGFAATVPADLSDVTAIAAGGFHSLALRSDRTVVAWGDNYEGETIVPEGLSNVVAIAAGNSFSLALRSDGTVVAWGDNFNGQTTVPVGLSNVVALAAGLSHSLALRSDGTVVAWGDNFNGQTTIPEGLSNVVAIAAGDLHSLALRSDGTISGWGRNGKGQTTVPEGLSNVVAIAAGGEFSLVLFEELLVAPVALLSEDNNFQGSVTATGFNGDGGGLTNLDTSQITSGTLSDARLSGNVSLLGGSIESAEITDGTILNEDISAVAAIADTKLATLATPGKVADTALSTNVARRADGNNFTGDQTFSGAVSVSNGISSSTGNSQFNFNGDYNDVTMTLRQRAGDNIALAVQDTATINRLLVTSGGVSVIGDITASGGVSGSGASLTGLNASQVTSGTLSDARLSGNVALRAGGNTFTGDQYFSGLAYVSSGIVSSSGNSQFNFNGGYGDVTMTLRQRAGDSIMLAVQDTETYNRLLVSSGGASVLGTFGVTGSIVASGTVTANGVLLTSDRNAKENFSPVDSQAVLAKVAALPLTEWRYKTDDQGVRHIGPMAQDFQAAFELSSDDTHISVVDQGGVALAAIQGLNEKVDSENDKLRAENADLKARLERLEQLLEDRLNEEAN